MNDQLTEIFERSKSHGFLGPGEISDHIIHSQRYIDEIGEGEFNIADIGSGGGPPAIAILSELIGTNVTMFDSINKRCVFLKSVISQMNWMTRATVECGRVEIYAHDLAYREQFDFVTARGFGPPGYTIECSLALLKVGGKIVISEPPGERIWPKETLAQVGLEKVESDEFLAVFVKRTTTNSLYPRTAKKMKASPLFTV